MIFGNVWDDFWSRLTDPAWPGLSGPMYDPAQPGAIWPGLFVTRPDPARPAAFLIYIYIYMCIYIY